MSTLSYIVVVLSIMVALWSYLEILLGLGFNRSASPLNRETRETKHGYILALIITTAGIVPLVLLAISHVWLAIGAFAVAVMAGIKLKPGTLYPANVEWGGIIGSVLHRTNLVFPLAVIIFFCTLRAL
jgi:hypothetical protein